MKQRLHRKSSLTTDTAGPELKTFEAFRKAAGGADSLRSARWLERYLSSKKEIDAPLPHVLTLYIFVFVDDMDKPLVRSYLLASANCPQRSPVYI